MDQDEKTWVKKHLEEILPSKRSNVSFAGEGNVTKGERKSEQVTGQSEKEENDQGDGEAGAEKRRKVSFSTEAEVMPVERLGGDDVAEDEDWKGEGEEEAEDEEEGYLVEEDMDDGDDDEVEPIDPAALKFEPGLLKALLSSGKLKPKPLHESAKEGDAAGVLDILENDEEHQVDEQDMFEYTPLHVASEHGKAEVVRAILAFVTKENNVEKRKKIINARAKFHDFTPGHFAAFNGHLECLKVLKESEDVDFSAETDDKRTFMHLAAFRGHKGVVEYLMTLGLDFEKKDADGDLPKDLAKKKEIRQLFTDTSAKAKVKEGVDT